MITMTSVIRYKKLTKHKTLRFTHDETNKDSGRTHGHATVNQLSAIRNIKTGILTLSLSD